MISTPLTVFKGGTAFNTFLENFKKKFPHTAYIVPITDDGGSSREIRRVFGGPSIGDLRSTLTRLSEEKTIEEHAVKKLLEYRLPNDEIAAMEWQALLENRHQLYDSISSKYKELIRYFLCQFEAQRLLRISHQFKLQHGSIGNFFFSGARMALGSLETAIFLYSSTAQISTHTTVLPIIDSNDELGIGVKFENEEIILGQHLISHPNCEGVVDKNFFEPLTSPIQELFYIDKLKNRITPKPHREVLNKLENSHGIIYATGSLWTSIIPSLVLEGIGEAIAANTCKKIGLLNCCHDRETFNMTAIDYIWCLTKSLNRFGKLSFAPKDYLTDLFIVKGCPFLIDHKAIANLGLQLHVIEQSAEFFFHFQHNSYSIYEVDHLLQSIFKTLKS